MCACGAGLQLCAALSRCARPRAFSNSELAIAEGVVSDKVELKVCLVPVERFRGAVATLPVARPKTFTFSYYVVVYNGT